MIWLYFSIFLAACVAVGTTGGLFPPGSWYETLKKPSWTPPTSSFRWRGPHFTCAWPMRVHARPSARIAGLALALWSLQIALNSLWTPVFFGLQRLKAGLMVLVCLWLSVAACMVALFQVDTVAGLLFLPYLVWVSVAGALNWSVMQLNPEYA